MKKLTLSILALAFSFSLFAQEPMSTLRGHTDLITGVAFGSLDGKVMGSAGSWENNLYIWNAGGAAKIKSINTGGQCMSLAFVNEDKVVTTAGNDVVLVSVSKGEVTKTLKGHTETAWHVTLNRQNTRISSSGWDNNCIVWDLKKGKAKFTLKGHTSYINRSAFSADGKQLATASEDMTVKIWDMRKGTLVKTITDHTGAASDVVYSPDGKYMATGGDENMVYIYNAKTYDKVATLPVQKDKVRALAFNEASTFLAVGCGSEAKEVNVYSTNGWKLTNTLTGPDSFVNNLAFSRDGKYLAGACSDKNVYVWDASKLGK